VFLHRKTELEAAFAERIQILRENAAPAIDRKYTHSTERSLYRLLRYDLHIDSRSANIS
jgi:hypothetical protein